MAYESYREVLLAPWANTRKPKPGSFKSVLNDTLDNMAKQWKRLYRAWVTSGTSHQRGTQRAG